MDRNYRIIDPHVHVWKHDPRFPWAPETTHPPEGDATPEMLLDLMRAHGVARTVLVQVIHYRWDNSYALDALRRYPEHFQAVARVNPNSPAAPDDLSRRVEEGFRGVRLSPAADAAGDWIDGPLMPPLWQRAESLGVPMLILAPATRLPDVERLIERYPALTVVIDHMADCPIDRPDLLEGLLRLARYPKVFVKISHTWSLSAGAYPYTDTFAQVKRVYDAFGPQRLMWGTDWPLIQNYCGYGKALSVVRDEMPFLNAEDKEWILGRTVERIWPFA
jgi:L-fuconolactonase